ncbi:response regulator FixJ [Sphingomonas sp. LM7]|uniref:response regulator FixJ n=1 Tax=Sphingomonas sp. LM7 TaxID=1938607 RepID=UPI000983C97E|nr:response regulator FixJ [Sphingomonas sp. LM7]AQR74856.1 DNA-binding response regulator [Sphingomonas sp. LM7]
MSNEPVVFVIDDDEGARHSLEFLIDVAGLRVRSFASADAFLEARLPLDHACVITDVRMPGMNGVELVTELKRRGASVPVIVITGHADVPLAIQAMRAGVADFIEKPFDDDTILAAIRAAFAAQAGRDEAHVERDRTLARLATLSHREREVMQGLVAGHANKVIAFDLEISARTVEVYRANVMTKMHAKSLSELVRMVTIAELAG